MSKIQQTFEQIKRAFEEKDRKTMQAGSLPMRSTAVGFWGVSNLDDVYEFFTQLNIDENTTFCDLGCGDGRVALVASLFCRATGIEYDEKLASEGQEIAAKLGLTVTIIAADILDKDLSGFDILYMYADRNFAYLEPKLLHEMSGELYLYHDTYHPETLKKGKTTWVGQIPIFKYTK